MISFDAVSLKGKVVNPEPSPVSWMHTTGSGSNRAFFVGLSFESTNASQADTDFFLDINGTAVMTSFGFESSNNAGVGLWYVKNPPVGSRLVSLQILTPDITFVDVGGISLFGVDQTTPVVSSDVNTLTGAIDTQPAIDNSGDWLLDAIYTQTGSYAPGSNQNVGWNDTGSGFGLLGSYKGPVTKADDPHMTWNTTGLTLGCSISVRPAIDPLDSVVQKPNVILSPVDLQNVRTSASFFKKLLVRRRNHGSKEDQLWQIFNSPRKLLQAA